MSTNSSTPTAAQQLTTLERVLVEQDLPVKHLRIAQAFDGARECIRDEDTLYLIRISAEDTTFHSLDVHDEADGTAWLFGTVDETSTDVDYVALTTIYQPEVATGTVCLPHAAWRGYTGDFQSDGPVVMRPVTLAERYSDREHNQFLWNETDVYRVHSDGLLTEVDGQ